MHDPLYLVALAAMFVGGVVATTVIGEVTKRALWGNGTKVEKTQEKTKYEVTIRVIVDDHRIK